MKSPFSRLLIIPGFIFFLLIGFYGVTSLYPDLLWFESFGFQSLWWFILKSKLQVFAAFFSIAFIWLYLNFTIARRICDGSQGSPKTDFNTPFPALNQILAELARKSTQSSVNQLPSKVLNTFITIGITILSIMLGLGAKSWWQDIHSYLNQTPFNLQDPIFSKDIGFYVFSLPLIEHLQGWFFSLLFFTLILVGWLYFAKNILLLIFSKDSKNTKLKPHLFILFGTLFALLAAKTWIKVHLLLFSPTGVVHGAAYTDINANLFYLKSLLVLLGIQAFLFLVFSFGSRMKLPFYFLTFIIAFSFIVGKVYPGILQKYVVSPNELEKEAPFIQHNIKFTRQAYKLNEIIEQEFPASISLSKNDISNNDITIKNVRLWNREPLKQTFSQLQEIRLYYRFLNVDVDRYMINGQPQQVMLSPRELDANELSTEAQTWINRHLIYTHGYGLCMTPVNEVSPEGLPNFYIKDLPPVSPIDISINRPEIYFGEKTSEYVIVNTSEEEFDYPKGDKNVYTSYQGKGGVLLDSFFKRVLYAFKFSDFSILFNTNISKESRIMYDREIKGIMEHIAPFITFDQDPYMVITDRGRLVWMVDGYTFTDKFPYATPFNRSINYIRNSVKLTIDAYNGEVHAYVADPEDPIINTLQKIYPMVFEPFSSMPTDLQAHIRYPQDLFKVQTFMYRTYHMTDTKVFYNKEDVWAIPTETYDGTQQVMDSYYMVTKIPGESEESFVLMIPYTPTNKNNMIAWMSAKSDLKNYGQLKVFKFPKDKTILGPMQIESRIDQDTEISQKLTLWGQSGSRVIRGNLMVVPIENSLIYVEPIYLQATQSTFPELKRVIFSYSDKVVMKQTLENAIETVFDGTYEQNYLSKQVQKTRQKVKKTGKLLVDSLVNEYQRFKKAAREQNWKKFGEGLDKIDGLINQLKEENKPLK